MVRDTRRRLRLVETTAGTIKAELYPDAAPKTVANFLQYVKDGYYDGSGLLSIRMRSLDMLTIGMLILNKGVYKGNQVVPSKWIRSIFDPEVHYPADWGFPNSIYGLDFYHFKYKGVVIMYGMGWGGQFMVIKPSLNAVVMTNENIADANAAHQSVAFEHQVFPVIYDLLTK